MKGKLTDKMNNARGKRLALIRRLYLVEDKTQQDIANYLGITRQRVGKILQSAGISR
jgi:DNA-binding transcriptional regulator LsrR (DeoR family)